MNCLIGTYTNEVKNYCDKQFFENLFILSKTKDVVIVDNSPLIPYTGRLKFISRNNPHAKVLRKDVPREPRISLFQRNVSDSANLLRDVFLKGDYDSLLIIESDVIPPHNLIHLFEEDVIKLNRWEDSSIEYGRDVKEWGILGALYYKGFHKYELTGLQETNHVLSGCTLYKREVIEKYPFRYDSNELGAFPDALISHDANKEYSLWNDHDIICEHLHTEIGTRMSKSL